MLFVLRKTRNVPDLLFIFIRRNSLPLTNFGQDIPSIVNSLRELSDHFFSVGRDNEAQQFLHKARELGGKNTNSS
jgi:hypothetical protein